MIVATAVILAGWGNSPPAATDAELLQLLGDSRPPEDRGIADGAVKCLGLISGLDQEVLKGAPKEVVGQFDIACRKELNQRLEDKDRNPRGFVLSDFENKELAQRVKTLAAARAAERQAKVNKAAEEARVAEAARQEVLRKEQGQKEKEIRDSTQAVRMKLVGEWKGEFGCKDRSTFVLRVEQMNDEGAFKATLSGTSIPGKSQQPYTIGPLAATGRVDRWSGNAGGVLRPTGIRTISFDRVAGRLQGPWQAFNGSFSADLDFDKMAISGKLWSGGSPCPYQLSKT